MHGMFAKNNSIKELNSVVTKAQDLIIRAMFQLFLAFEDYVKGFMSYRMWLSMAFTDMRRRYRRTLIGPLWATLNLAIFVTSMGLLFSTLWKSNTSVFLPYFASGFVCWTFFSTAVIDGCSTFIGSEGLIKQIPFKYSIFAWLVLSRNFIVFLHQVVVYIIIAFIFHVPTTRYMLLLIPGFLLLFFSISWISILLGLFCARFRDVQQVIVSLLQISMFVTPIFWPEKQLGHSFKTYILVNLNPLYHYISIVRQPLLGKAPHEISWIVVIVTTIIGWIITMLVFAKQYRKLIFWL